MQLRNKINLPALLKYVLGSFAALIASLHLISIALQNQYPEISQIFDLDNEKNVPTVYSGILLGCSAFICLVLVSQNNRKSEKARWIFLGLLFFYLAFDEILVIHETFGEPIRNFFSITAGNVFYHAWVLPALLVTALIIGLALIIKDRDQISKLQKKVLLYTAILATGVILLEIIGTKLYFSEKIYKLGPVLLEEMFEISMVSFILFKLTIAAFTGRQT